jgi:hypothetical protein
MAEEQQAVEEISIDTLPAKEYNEARDKGVTTVPKVPVAEETKPEVSEEKEGEEKPDEKPKVKGGYKARIDRLVKHNAELETAKDAAERERDELRAKNGKTEERPAPKADSEPKIEDFQTGEEFYRAQARWEVRQEMKVQAEAKEKEEEDAYTKEVFDTHNRTISEARAKYDDFNETVNDSVKTPWQSQSKADVMASQAFQVAMFESGMGGELLYYLGKHPDELAKLGGLSPARVQMAVGRIIDKLEAQQASEEENEEEQEIPPAKEEKPKIVSKAPAPIRPVGGSSTKSSVPLDKMSMADYEKARAAGRIR